MQNIGIVLVWCDWYEVCPLWVFWALFFDINLYGTNGATLKSTFTVILMCVIYRKWFWGGGAGCCEILLCPFGLTLPWHSRAHGRCPVATGYFGVDPLPFTLPNCFKHSQQSGAAVFNQTPKNSPGGVGWLQTPARVRKSHVLHFVLP